MFKILLALHVLFAIFAIGPLVHAATTAGRGVRQNDATATTAAGRMLRIYAMASVLVVLLGFGLMSAKSPHTGEATAKISETWIWLSGVLWLIAVGLVLGLIVPALEKATELIESAQPAGALTARVSAAGGIVGLIFAGIVFLMIYRPGS
ncbi:MAG: hypothetical protein JWN61_2178 [Pseudonocardiales bacterium]|nr:hypothetical protein [Pseudonocardiales bacterium]